MAVVILRGILWRVKKMNVRHSACYGGNPGVVASIMISIAIAVTIFSSSVLTFTVRLD